MDDFIKNVKNGPGMRAGICTPTFFPVPFGPTIRQLLLITAFISAGFLSLPEKANAEKAPAETTLSEATKNHKQNSNAIDLSYAGRHTFEELELSLLSSSVSEDSDSELIRKFQLDPSDPRWPYLLSILYLRLKMQDGDGSKYLLDSSAKMARQSFEISRGDAFGYLALANLLSFGRQHEKALTILEKIKGAFPKEGWRADLFEIKFLFAAGRAKDAVTKIQLIMSHENKSVRLTAMNLCATLCDENLISISEKDLLAWRKSSPSPDTFAVIARFYSAKGQTIQVRKVLQDGLRSFPSHAELTRELAFELTSNSPTNPDYAIKLLDSSHNLSSAATPPGKELVQRSLDYKITGFAWLLKKNLFRAESYFLKALALNPTPEFALKIIEDYRAEKSSRAGLSFLEKAIEICPGSSSLHALKGELYAEESKGLSMSENSYFDAISLNPRDASHFNSLGLLYYKFNRLEKALTSFAVATALDPTDASAFYNLACMEALTGKNEKALVALKKAIELAPNLQALATTDRDLNSLHVMPGFSELTSRAPSH